MPNEALARRYATAIFQLATEAGAVEDIGRDLHTFIATLAADKDVDRFFRSPAVDRTEKAAVIAAAFDRLHDIALHAVLLLIRKRREAIAPEIVAQYDVLERQARGAQPLNVTTARPLSKAELDALVAKLTRGLQNHVRCHRERRPRADRRRSHHDGRQAHRRHHRGPPRRPRAHAQYELEKATMINADEIAGIIKQRIATFKTGAEEAEVGTVIEVGDNIARIYGLEAAQASELVQFPNGVEGVVLNLEEDNVGVAIMGPDTDIKEGDQVRRTGRIVSVPVGEALLGRVVNPLGAPVDGKGPIETKKWRTIENRAPGVVQRQGVKQPLQTGIRAIDALIPIGKGQRELIIGDRGTGKTAIAVDTIINQKGKNVFCIYVAIGQKNSTVAALAQTLEQNGAMEYTTIVTVSPAEPAALKWIAPFAGCAMGEELMYAGKDVLIIYDNLTQHAQAYREVSLLLRRPPGREAYPGDIFFLHSRLLERAAKLSDELGGGSLTALPVIETQAGDVSAYIPTNLISITDGQIYLQTALFFQGIRPAVDVGISVSRVGGSAQIKAMRTVAGPLKLDLAQFRELAAFAKLASDLDKNTQQQLTRGEKITEVLKQPQFHPQPVEEQVAVIFAATRGYLDEIPTNKIAEWETSFVHALNEKHREILETIRTTSQLSDDNTKALIAAIEEFNKSF